MAQQAVVTLTALRPDIVPATRILRLSPDHLTIPIGRASKSISKGLLGAEDNGWFDNPVMSRDHAELIFDPISMSVSIRDIRSMHGTQLNDVKLPPTVALPVKSGDKVSFGAEVRRGLERFPPCCFHLEYKLAPWRRGFQCPDSSDIEDEQDHNEEEVEIRSGSQVDDLTPAESPSHKESTSSHTIKDEAELVDISDELSSISHDTEDRAPSTPCQEKTSPAGRVDNPIILEDIESEEEGDDYDIEDEGLSDDSSNGEDSDKENDNVRDEYLDEQVPESVFDVQESEAVVGLEYSHEIKDHKAEQEDPSSLQASKDSIRPYIGDTHTDIDDSMAWKLYNEVKPLVTHMFSDNKDIPISSLRTTVQSSSSENQVAEAGDHDCRSASELNESILKFNNIVKDTTKTLDKTEDSHVTEPLVCEDSNGGFASVIGSDVHTGATSQSVSDLQPRGAFANRQPSPSDAAMPKSMIKGSLSSPNNLGDAFSNGKTINPVHIHHLPAYESNQFTAQTLEERTDKQEFFRAREINRARLTEEMTHVLYPYPTPSEMSNIPPPIHSLAKVQYLCPTDQQASHKMVAHERRIHQVAAHGLAQRTMATEATPNGPLRTRSPEWDMTSAVNFNRSKAANETSTTALQKTRSAVRIDDIVEPVVTKLTTKSLKRKAAEISDVLEEEVRVWASNDASIPIGNVGVPSGVNIGIPEQTPQKPQIPQQEFETPVMTVSAAPQERAGKRLKRFAEIVGFAALTTAAVGAGLLSVLAATAPEFP